METKDTTCWRNLSWKLSAIQPLQSNQSPNALKYAILMWRQPNITRNLWMPYSSGHCHWIRLAMAYNG